jgi:Leucine-rich repeat (LRR) protein
VRNYDFSKSWPTLLFSLSRTDSTDADLKELIGLKDLHELDLIHTQVTDAGLKELSGLKNLRSLLLQGTKVTDAGLKELSGLKNLQTTSVTKVTDAASALSQQREGQGKDDARTSEFKKLESALQGQPAGLEERLSN